MSTWTHLMIHCSDTPSSFDVTEEHIKKWHLEGRGWSRVGYSMLVKRSGEMNILIPFDRDDVIESWELSNGARGWNGSTKHICWAGGKARGGHSEDNRTINQHITLGNIVRMLVMLYPEIKLIGHNQVNKNKYCPSFDVPAWATEIDIPEKNIDFQTYY